MIAVDIVKNIADVLKEQPTPCLFIVRKLADVCNGDSILFDDLQRKEQLWSDSYSGYVEFVGASLDDILKLLRELYALVGSGDCAVANLWILASRINLSTKDEWECEELLRTLMGDEQRRRVYTMLAETLTEYMHSYDDAFLPSTLKEWMYIMQFHGERRQADLVRLLLDLVSDGREVGIAELFQLPPLFIGIAVGMKGYRLSLTAKDALRINDKIRLTLLGAKALDFSFDKYYVPSWLSLELVTRFIKDMPDLIGTELLNRVWRVRPGAVYYNRTMYALMIYCRKSVLSIITFDNEEAFCWIDGLSDIENIGIVLYLIRSSKIAVSDAIKRYFAIHVIKRFAEETKEFHKALTEKHLTLPMSCVPFYFKRYKFVFAELAECFSTMNNEDTGQFRKLLYSIKGLFCGGYYASHFAMQITELLLLTMLHSEKESDILHTMFRDMDKFVMVSYTHLAERSNAIWDPDYKITFCDTELAKIIINNAIYTGLNSVEYGNREIVREISRSISSAKTTLWPYERTYFEIYK